jgi:prepilin-type N-terminal cleavage/methylation domain-containing protein
MLMPKGHIRRGQGEAGFTLLELVIVCAIMGVVLVVAGGGLISLSTTTNRGSAMVADEQGVSTAMAQIGKDVRSAHSIAFPTAAIATDAPNEIILQVTNPAGGTTPVEWVYQTVPATLTREVLSANLASVVSTGPPITRVANSTTTPLFSYYDRSGTQIFATAGSATALGNIVRCATRITVQLVVSAGVSGVANFQESEDVALTDQLAILSAPGNGQCG